MAYLWVVCALNWASRVRGVFRRLQQPHLRGAGWFFDVAVDPGFYAGEGRAIERGYRLRMAAPIAAEVAFWIVALAGGHVAWLFAAAIAMVPIIHLNHWYNVQRAERAARSGALAQAPSPVASLGLSLKPRRLRDFTNVWVEAGIWLGTVASFAWLWRAFAEGRLAPGQAFGAPLLLVYLQLGFLLAKQVIVSWRAPVPLAQRTEYLEARDAMRRYYLWTCDCNRIMITLRICLVAAGLGAPAPVHGLLVKGWEALWLALCVGLAVWTEIKRKQVAAIGVRARPMRLPDLSGRGAKAGWPVCFEPGVPMLVLQGERGYTVNLANTAAYLALAYAVGMAGIAMLVRMGR